MARKLTVIPSNLSFFFLPIINSQLDQCKWPIKLLYLWHFKLEIDQDFLSQMLGKVRQKLKLNSLEPGMFKASNMRSIILSKSFFGTKIFEKRFFLNGGSL